MPWASNLVLCPWCQNAQQNCLVQPHVHRGIWKCECAWVCECMHACMSVSCGCYVKIGVLHHITQNFCSMNSRSALHLHVALTWLRLGELFLALDWPGVLTNYPSIAYVTSTVLVNACWEGSNSSNAKQNVCVLNLFILQLYTQAHWLTAENILHEVSYINSTNGNTGLLLEWGWYTRYLAGMSSGQQEWSVIFMSSHSLWQ